MTSAWAELTTAVKTRPLNFLPTTHLICSNQLIVMASLLDLSAELKFMIIEPLSHSDLKSFSCACKVLRSVAAPRLFRDFVLENSEESGNIVKSVSDGPYKEYVRYIHYRGIIDMPCTQYDLVTNVSKDEDFPAIVEQILGDLTLFPKLEGLTVEFPWDGEQVDHEFLSLQNEEIHRKAVIAEKQKAWRVLMARSYAAIGQAADPQHPSLKSLGIRNLVAKEVTTWASEGFRKFLAQLQIFSLSIRGINNLEDWALRNVEGYTSFIPRLDRYFFNHLLNVESFSFMASESGIPGLEGLWHISFPLNANQMPTLKRLELNYIFIAPELSDFLNSHVKAIEIIRLENCFSAVGESSEATNAISWAQLFTSFIEAGPTKLKEFEIFPAEVSFEDGHSNGDIIMTARKLGGTPGCRAFAHGFMDTRYGLMTEDEGENLASFFRGENQKAFDRLLAIIESNV